MRVIAGIGCRAGCPAQDIVDLVRQASASAGKLVTALAAPEFKAAEGALREAARLLEVPLLLVDRERLQAVQPHCPTRSDVAARVVGVPSVAEGSAVAAAGPGARLVAPRIAGPRVTCALAEGG